jgi:hypothetical protein
VASLTPDAEVPPDLYTQTLEAFNIFTEVLELAAPYLPAAAAETIAHIPEVDASGADVRPRIIQALHIYSGVAAQVIVLLHHTTTSCYQIMLPNNATK